MSPRISEDMTSPDITSSVKLGETRSSTSSITVQVGWEMEGMVGGKMKK